jgi:quinol-cytochrome oxidoreductase complex cytochrome b subunit
MHLIALHKDASNNAEGISSVTDRIRFHPYLTIKDAVGIFWYFLFFSLFIFFFPHILGDSENSIPANSLVTPAAIVPEWYFLAFYAILRSIPNKLLGVIAMFSAKIILIPLSLMDTLNVRSLRYRPILQFLFWVFVMNFLFLIWLGAKPIAQPYTFLGQISTFIYFSYFIILILLG